MKEITLTNYESVEEFIEVVDSVHFWDSIDADDYREALAKVGLDYDSYNDPEEMWNDFMKAIEEQEEQELEGIKMKVKKWVRTTSKLLLFIGVCVVFGLAGNCDLYPTFPMKKVLIYTLISIVLFSPYFFIFIHDIEDDSKK